MSRRSDKPEDFEKLREKLIGLGERSIRKSYYPKLQQQVQELERAEARIRELSNRYELILESAGEGIFGLDLDGNYSFMNRAAARMLGYEPEELIGKHSHSAVHYCKPDGTLYPEEECRTYASFKDGVARHVDDEVFCRKDGSRFPVEYTSMPIREDGTITGAVVTFSDITERKRSEEALKLTQFSVDHSAAGAFLIGKDGRLLYVNEQACRNLGYTREELLSMTVADIDPDMALSEWSDTWRRLKQEGTFHLDRRHRKKDGTLFPVEITANYVSFAGNEYNWAFSIDISERKQAEQEKQRAMGLLEEAQYIAGIGNWERDVRSNKLTASAEVFRILGIDPAQLESGYEAFLGMLHPEDRPVIANRIAEAFRVRKEATHNEYRMVRPDGEIRILDLRTRYQYDKAGALIAMRGTVEDVTETRRAEKKLKLTQFAVDTASVSMFLIGPDARILYVNDEACRSLQYSREELLTMTVYDLHPRSAPLADWNKDWQQLKTVGSVRGEAVHQKKDGTIINVDISARYISFGGREYDWAFSLDITERKKAEQRLHESEERFRQLAEKADQVFWFSQPSPERVLYVSPAFERIWRRPVEDIYRNPRLWLEAIHQDDRTRVKEVFESWLSGKSPVYDAEYRIVQPDGGIRWIHDRGTLIRDPENRIVRTSGIAIDITDSKRAQQDIQRTKELLEEAQQIAGIGNWEWDRQAGSLTWSDEVYRIFGLNRSRFAGTFQAYLEMVHPDDRPRIERNIAEAARTRRDHVFNEYRIVRPDGAERIVHTRSRFLYTDEGRLSGMRGIVQDVTEARQAEEALKLTQFSLEHAAVAAFFIAPDSRILYANKHASRELGFSRQELLSMTISDIDPNFPQSAWPEHWQELKKKRFLYFESLHRRKDGTQIPVNISVNYLFYGGKEYNIGFSLDITARKRAEESLRQYSKLTETILDSMSDPISLIDVRDFTIVRVNKVFLEKYGYSDQREVAGKHCYEITHHRSDVCSAPDDICPLIETVKTRDHYATDHVHYDIRGKKIYVEVSTSPIRDESGNVIQVVHVQRDITERKKAEEALRLSEARFRNLFKQSAISMQILSPDGRAVEVNHAFEELWGLNLEDLQDYNILRDQQLIAKGIMPYIEKGFAGEATEIPVTKYDAAVVDQTGRERWVKAFIYPVKAGDGTIHQVVLMHMNMTETVKAVEALQDSEERFRAFFELAAVGTTQIDPVTMKFARTNQRFCEMTGYTCEELRSMTFNDLTHPDDRTVEAEQFAKTLRPGAPTYEVEKRYIRKDGRIIWVYVSATVVHDSRGRPLHTAAIVQDITERKRLEEEISHLAHHDMLTGLPNRRLFNEIAALELAQAERNRKRFAVLFLDLDRFKEINDTLGHQAGDELLRQVASRLKSIVRKSDSIARIGGDEFNLILADIARPDDVSDISRKVIDSFRPPFIILGHKLHITTSVGISIYPDDSTSLEVLLRYADMAMYHAKERGRNTFQFYDPSINIRSIERMRLENMLRRSLELGEMVVYYQPLVHIASGSIICAEALLRWRHPERGLLLPRDFMLSAEETGFIAEIDEWVLRSVCRQIRSWQDEGLPPFCVTVNLSARQFQDPGLLGKIAAILEETGASPECLDIEIPESMAMSDVDRSVGLLKKLAGMGIHISIDDFGTGYSSLNYLKRMPIEKLKIDQSFVKDIVVDRDDREIIDAVTAMAHNMNMKVIAEGVENAEQLSLLSKSRCDEAQGFFFSEAVPPERFRELVKAGR